MTKDKAREAFENWYAKEHGVKPKFNRNLDASNRWDADKELAWEGYQAALATNEQEPVALSDNDKMLLQLNIWNAFKAKFTESGDAEVDLMKAVKYSMNHMLEGTHAPNVKEVVKSVMSELKLNDEKLVNLSEENARLREALRSILGWRELRNGKEFPIARIEEIADEALADNNEG